MVSNRPVAISEKLRHSYYYRLANAHSEAIWKSMHNHPVLLHAYILCFGFNRHVIIVACPYFFVWLYISTFWHCHPYILQHFNGNVVSPIFFVVHTVKPRGHPSIADMGQILFHRRNPYIGNPSRTDTLLPRTTDNKSFPETLYCRFQFCLNIAYSVSAAWL